MECSVISLQLSMPGVIFWASARHMCLVDGCWYNNAYSYLYFLRLMLLFITLASITRILSEALFFVHKSCCYYHMLDYLVDDYFNFGSIEDSTSMMTDHISLHSSF
jgi:hypothetical protein